MNFNLDVLGKEGLQFYGTVSASISHEIKNVLAVLNENAGLLEDLVLMTQKGIPLNNERIGTLASAIKKQIQRGDTIAVNLNRFAHSVDDPVKTVDTGEVVALVVSLTRRSADMKGVRLKICPEPERAEISTHPFFLEHLLWCCLDAGIPRTGEEKTIDIAYDRIENGIAVTFTGLTDLSSSFMDVFPGPRETALLTALNAKMEISPSSNRIRILLPKNIDT
jgi:C4-dicarboxylate-specific signal transduction histidine kinase